MKHQISPKKLVASWNAQGFCKLQSGLSVAEIAAFSNNENLAVPADLSEYLCIANGFRSSDKLDMLEKNGFEFLPLVKQNLRFMKYFVFCQWPYGLLEYAICLGEKNSGKVFLLGDDATGQLLADSFSEFVELYLTDAMTLYKPDSKSEPLF